jgi:hypothetical protein
MMTSLSFCPQRTAQGIRDSIRRMCRRRLVRTFSRMCYMIPEFVMSECRGEAAKAKA